MGGALLFALDAWMGTGEDDPSYQVVVSAGQIDRLQQAWQAQSGRVPSEEEMNALIEDQVREEIFYREAVRRGLDDGDVLVRRRLAQKLSFLIEDLAAVEEPSEDALRRFYGDAERAYVQPARLSFRHVFFSRDRRADAAADAGAALATLPSGRGAAAAAATALGDPFMLHSEYAGRNHQEVRELFGPEFADSVFALLRGESWQGPVESSLRRAPRPGSRPGGRADAAVRGSARGGAARLPAGASRGGQQPRRTARCAARYEVEVEEARPDREARQ